MNALDLPAYFARIGFAGTPGANLDTLKALHRLHPAAITFENLDPLMGRPVPLDLPSIADKLIARGRGGYCYEHNTLLEAVLRSLGFQVSSIAGSVRWRLPPNQPTPRYHMLLRIDLPEGPYIADVGFGRLTLTAPLRLVADEEQETPHGPHRLAQVGNEFQLQAKLPEGWAPLYQFSLETKVAGDWEVANWYTSTSPQSVFTQQLMVARPVGTRRYALFNNDLSIHDADGRRDRRHLASADELAAVLRDTFAINLPEGSAPILERLTSAADTS